MCFSKQEYIPSLQQNLTLLSDPHPNTFMLSSGAVYGSHLLTIKRYFP